MESDVFMLMITLIVLSICNDYPLDTKKVPQWSLYLILFDISVLYICSKLLSWHVDFSVNYLYAYWVILHVFLLSADFFSKSTFSYFLSGILSVCQTLQLDPDQNWCSVGPVLSVKTVCKGYISRRQRFAQQVKILYSFFLTPSISAAVSEYPGKQPWKRKSWYRSKLFANVISTRQRWSAVVECLTRDRELAGLSLTGVTALWSLSKTHLS